MHTNTEEEKHPQQQISAACESIIHQRLNVDEAAEPAGRAAATGEFILSSALFFSLQQTG